MNNTEARLALTSSEKKTLRRNGITLKDIPDSPVSRLQFALGGSVIRAMEIKALTEFQSLPSIGPKFAHDLVLLGYYSLEELKDKDPAKLFNDFERLIGAWADPCIEDQFRLVVHHANNPTSESNWWDFTAERKNYREQKGYPRSRPTKAWYELDQYKKINKVDAKVTITKKDLLKRVRSSMAFIKENYTNRITLAELSKVALLSPFHFQRTFKSVYDLSPLEFITHLRLKKACQLLRKTKRPVSRVAIDCGFESASSFIRLFRQRFRQTPFAYRKSRIPNSAG